MRNVLQSKTGVGCLAAVAVLCVAANFVNFPQGRATTATARENAVPVEEAREDSYEVPPLSSVGAELRAWRELFPLETLRRDPFAAVFVALPATVTNVPTMPAFQLQAVSLAAGRALAVVNHHVIAEGDVIEGCRVEKILPHEVRLVSPVFGPVTATFDRTPIQSKATSENKPPSGKLPPADLPASPAAASPGGTGGTTR